MFNHGLSMSKIKKYNRSLILKELYNKHLTRSEIAKKLNLTKAAISLIIDEMLSLNILFEKQNEDRKTKSIYKKKLSVNYNYKLVWGISVNTDYIGVGISNLKGEILGKKTVSYNDSHNNKDIIDEILKLIKKIEYECGFLTQNILGCGLCISENILSKDDFEIEALIQNLELSLKTQVVIENMTDTLAIHEYFLRPQTESLFLIRYTNDLFSSFIYDNHILKLKNSKGFSHTIISNDNTICPICGKMGCAYNYMSGDVIERQINEIYSKDKTPNLYSSLGKQAINPGKQSLSNVFWFNDDSIINIVKSASSKFSKLLLNIYEVLNPDSIIFCGRMIENERFLQAFYDSISNFLPDEVLSILDTGSTNIKNNYIAGCYLAIIKLFINEGGL